MCAGTISVPTARYSLPTLCVRAHAAPALALDIAPAGGTLRRTRVCDRVHRTYIHSMLTPEMSPVVLQSLRFDIETISPTAGYQVPIECGASLQDGTALKALTQLETASRNLCGQKYASKSDQIACGKDKEHWHVAAVKGVTDKTNNNNIDYKSFIDRYEADPSYRETLSAIGCNSTGSFNPPSTRRTQNGKTRRWKESITDVVRKS